MADKMLKIELKKSLIGRGAKQIATAEALGLKKPGDVTVQPDNAATQGKIAIVLLSKTQCTIRYCLDSVSLNFKCIISFCFILNV